MPPSPIPSTRSVRSGRFSVVGMAETDPVPHSGDAADDPAIWIHPTDPALSVVFGTDKSERGGLFLYDLGGREIGSRLDGAMNNVDVRGNVVVAGNEEENTVAVYRMCASRGSLEPAVAEEIRPELTIYGTCLYREPDEGRLFVFVTSEDGDLEQWELTETVDGFHGTFARAWALESQVEGCVADDAHRALYVGEERVGIWRFAADPDAGAAGTLIASTDDGELEPDVEGLTLAAYPDGTGFLLASSQGNDTYVAYDRQDYSHLGTFSIKDGDDVDGTSNTDGIALTAMPVGPSFPAGLLVVHDGRNADENQNFKLVGLDQLLR
jgi:3-phytase